MFFGNCGYSSIASIHSAFLPMIFRNRHRFCNSCKQKADVGCKGTKSALPCI